MRIQAMFTFPDKPSRPHGLEELKSALQRSFSDWLARMRYHPERHYMRGPGPKSRQRSQRGDGNAVKH